MSLSVSNQNINSGLDAASIKEVTQQIFQRANAKNSALSSIDLTQFNRVALGTDLYSGKVDSSTARQIALTNSGMQVTLSNDALDSLKYLNSQASQSIFKSTDAKVSVAISEADTDKTTSLPTFGRLTETTDLDSDKKGSNPFYKGELLNATKKEEKEDSLNIFA